MEKYITIKDIQKCLKSANITWDGLKGRTEFGGGELATIEDFENENLVPIMVTIKGFRHEQSLLLKVSDFIFNIYEEQYHPHNDDYIILYESLCKNWQDQLLSDYTENYSKLLIKAIDESIKNNEEDFKEDFEELEQQMKDLQDKYQKVILDLQNEKKRIHAVAEVAKELSE